MKKYGYFNSKTGLIEIIVENEQLVNLSFVEKPQFVNRKDDIVIANCLQQLAMYFDKKLTKFSLPMVLKGTPFQELVWSKTCAISYGTTLTYEQLAINIGHPKAVRAVGTALGKNLVAIIVPCHRVVSKNKNIINYRYGADIKTFLLNLEKL
ncbi:methylated-DNA--[protein]-cysteine S-methyltransferase [Spiroplasma endosymbiont of Nebria brevicollis]|uniref:methylated-DNA--[protein]-cysteine S-methyltransferase n=1 Tax=Spiroplasma endosymbiont of Nebria brevicollis TaxID=3066284 RepID=UPI00313CF25C